MSRARTLAPVLLLVLLAACAGAVPKPATGAPPVNPSSRFVREVRDVKAGYLGILEEGGRLHDGGTMTDTEFGVLLAAAKPVQVAGNTAEHSLDLYLAGTPPTAAQLLTFTADLQTAQQALVDFKAAWGKLRNGK